MISGFKQPRQPIRIGLLPVVLSVVAAGVFGASVGYYEGRKSTRIEPEPCGYCAPETSLRPTVRPTGE